MKKVIIIAAILVVAVIAGAIIASILLQPEELSLSGTYSNEVIGTGRTLTFDGDKVVATYRSAGVEVYTVTGKYTVGDGVLSMTFDDDENIPHNVFEGEFTFGMGEDHIIIDGIRYQKAEPAAE